MILPVNENACVCVHVAAETPQADKNHRKIWRNNSPILTKIFSYSNDFLKIFVSAAAGNVLFGEYFKNLFLDNLESGNSPWKIIFFLR